MTKQIEKVDTTKIKQISDSQSGTSEEERQKLQVSKKQQQQILSNNLLIYVFSLNIII